MALTLSVGLSVRWHRWYGCSIAHVSERCSSKLIRRTSNPRTYDECIYRWYIESDIYQLFSTEHSPDSSHNSVINSSAWRTVHYGHSDLVIHCRSYLGIYIDEDFGEQYSSDGRWRVDIFTTIYLNPNPNIYRRRNHCNYHSWWRDQHEFYNSWTINF